MASNGVGEGGAHLPEMASTTLPSQIPPEENESEWEYEYSNTETETFYVTLDLSKADFTDRDANAILHPNSKGNEKADRAKLYLNKRMSPDGSDGDSPNDSDEDDEEHRNLPVQETMDDADDHQVQIMELHSEKPIISYKGRVYQGQWSQNIGTEFLITKRDEDNPLPVIRHLDNDVELLAASCARITVDEVQLKPQERPSKRRRNVNFTKEANAMRPIVPPAERWSTQTRRDQGNFLASLIELKKRRGEADEVTVVAKGIDLRVNHNRARKRKGHRGKFNLPHLRGPRRPRGADLLRTLSIREQSVAPSPDASREESPDETISTPTPLHWDDLERQEEDYEGDDDDAVMGDVDEEAYENEEEEFEGDEEDELDEIGYSGSGEEGSVDDMDVDED
ncbi:Histidine biosynthesis bifunctional protein hisB [Hypoxylon texense]